MGKSRCIVLIIIMSMMCVSCLKKEANTDFFTNENFHFALYTNPSSDCIECILKALRALNTDTDQADPIYVFIKHSDDKDRFINYLKSEFRPRTIKFFDRELNAPSPAIVLIRKKNIYMWLYIQNDPFLFDLSIKKCLQLLTNFNT